MPRRVGGEHGPGAGAYEDWAKAQARIQRAKAGFRLAALFKAIFEP